MYLTKIEMIEEKIDEEKGEEIIEKMVAILTILNAVMTVLNAGEIGKLKPRDQIDTLMTILKHHI
jgi:hypothetical protein